VARFKPAIFIDRWSKLKLVLPPGQHIPGQRFIGGPVLGLKSQRMAHLVRGQGKRQGDAVLGIAVNAVSADLLHEGGDRVRPGATWISRSLVPHHHGKQHPHAAEMKVSNHLLQAIDAARHGANHVVLITIVDAHIWIGSPDQDSIDAAIALVEVVQVAINRVLPALRIVEVAVMHHHLRLDETGLRPLQSRYLIPCAIVANANAALCPPMGDICKPLLMSKGRAGRVASLPRAAQG
jgi:hypothetical protein